ncbi:MAG TPA: nucleotidyltransferase domain-containing protein, partial [Candidatus Paceibacterota bacterium]|nr:nucleotidyltransferase domain-containing protein [Candidatus Paceibacterota bacterium]
MELPRPVELYIQDLERNRLGAAVFGSWARGDNRPDSDVDVLVLTDGLERRGVDKIGNVNVEIVYTSEEGAKRFAFKRMDSFLNMWRDAQIIFDTNGGLKRLKEFAEQTESAGKPAMETWQLEHKQFDIVDAVHAVESLAKQDPATAEMYLQRTVYNLLQFYFDKQRI